VPDVLAQLICGVTLCFSFISFERSFFRSGSDLGMSPQPPHQITRLLQAWRDGDTTARDDLMTCVYGELHRLARGYMRRERPGHTLQTTALINEAYVRLMGQSRIDWQSRSQFFGVAAQFMRRILVDYARARQSAKRQPAGSAPVPLDEAAVFAPERAPALIALDDALDRLATVDARKARVVELRYFGGLTVEETADLLDVSPVTVMRDWSLAKAWLQRELTGGA
jgi:RNA polymerase sigma-70 factor, ECF subfamily